MWRMIHEVQLGRACDSLRHELEKEVTIGVNAQEKAYAMIEAQKAQIAYRDEAATVQSERILNQLQANQELRKEVNRQKRHKVLAIGIGAILVVLAAL